MNKEFIATTETGKIVNQQEAIFPIMKQLEGNSFRLIGTGTFVTQNGIFLTAKHILKDVLDENNNSKQKYPIVAFLFSGNSQYKISSILNAFLYDNSDIAIGQLDYIDGNPYYGLSCTPLNPGDDIHTYVYPKTTSSRTQIYFQAENYHGQVIEYLPNGRDKMLPNPCYHTNMEVLSGASGGPAFNKDGNLVGVNSTGYDISKGEDPISYISCITEDLKSTLEKTLL